MDAPGQHVAFFLCDGRERLRLHVEQQSFETAGDAQQFAVALFAPAPRDVEFVERGVEGHEVTVALGFRERAVDVPEDGFKHQGSEVDSERPEPLIPMLSGQRGRQKGQARYAR